MSAEYVCYPCTEKDFVQGRFKKKKNVDRHIIGCLKNTGAILSWRKVSENTGLSATLRQRRLKV